MEIEKRPVKLTLLSRHVVASPEKLGKYGTLFNDIQKNIPETPADDFDDEIDPEDYPEEMGAALKNIMGDDEEEAPEIDEIIRKCEEFAEKIKILESDANDALEFRTMAWLSLNIDERGKEFINIEYIEDESMDNTSTVISYYPSNPGSVTILHNGSVMSSLILEHKKRHISVYTTPIMPFEVAVYTKKCSGKFSFESGGEMELDYLVELRGTDIQRTVMSIKAEIV